jgi:hypothetical protein
MTAHQHDNSSPFSRISALSKRLGWAKRKTSRSGSAQPPSQARTADAPTPPHASPPISRLRSCLLLPATGVPPPASLILLGASPAARSLAPSPLARPLLPRPQSPGPTASSPQGGRADRRPRLHPDPDALAARASAAGVPAEAQSSEARRARPGLSAFGLSLRGRGCEAARGRGGIL